MPATQPLRTPVASTTWSRPQASTTWSRPQASTTWSRLRQGFSAN